MWEINNTSQFFSFFIAIAFGIGYSCIYDILRAIRKAVKLDDITVFFQDIIYFLIIMFITFLLSFSLSNGQIRSYIVFGLAVGFIVCFLTLSRFNVKIFGLIFKFISSCYERIIEFLNLNITKIEKIIINYIKKSFKWLKNRKKLKKALEKQGAGVVYYM